MACLRDLGQLPVRDLSLTTNGSLLTEARARTWHAAGLRRITFSLDSLRPRRVAAITRSRSSPQTVIDAVEAARRAGLDPIKVNAVIMRGINDDEVAGEGAMMATLALVGVEPASATAVSITLGLMLIVVSLPGGLFWLLSRPQPGEE